LRNTKLSLHKQLQEVQQLMQSLQRPQKQYSTKTVGARDLGARVRKYTSRARIERGSRRKWLAVRTETAMGYPLLRLTTNECEEI
jgi:hypothetical protein